MDEEKKVEVVKFEEKPAAVQEVVTPPVESKDIVVIARNQQEMEVAQKKLVNWAEGRLQALKVDHSDLKANYEIAKKNKWRTETLKRQMDKAQKKMEFYEKVKRALDAGFVIIPNFDIDVFAIRTMRKEPRENMVTGTFNRPKDQTSERPPAGKGEYKNNQAVVFQEDKVVEHNAGEQPKRLMHRWAEEFQDVDFPFHLAKPEVLNDTARAMALKVFDEVGVLPRQRRGDPMVVGRITFKDGGFHRKDVSFLISWFVDTRDL